MSLTIPTYCTREVVKAALDVAGDTRTDSNIDRAIEAAARTTDGRLRRWFTPWDGTRYFDWPSSRYGTSWRLWLDENELVSLTSITAGGTTLSSTFLEPQSTGPPYTHIETDISSSSAFAAGDTHQRAIAVTGTFGYTDEQVTVGTLAANLTASTSASPSITWTDLPAIGIGSMLSVNSERMLVTARSWADSTQNVGGSGLTASNAGVALTVSDGTAFTAGEVLLLDSEQVRIDAISGNVLTIKRAWNGSVLAAHTTSADIYRLSSLTVTRAVRGSTIAAHTSGDTVTVWAPPPLVRDLAAAYALAQHLQEGAGYARVAGSGENSREVLGRGLKMIEADAMQAHGRKFQVGAV